MARLVRGDQVFDAWIEDRTDGVWLCTRDGDGPIRVHGPERSSVEYVFTYELSTRLRDGWRRVRDVRRLLEAGLPVVAKSDRIGVAASQKSERYV